MKKYKVLIEEVITYTAIVEAENDDDAEYEAWVAYQSDLDNANRETSHYVTELN